jgi:acetoin utilization deacetylase AcuC-like enzyme
MVLFLSDPLCLEHQQNDGHPECPERLEAIEDALMHVDFKSVRRASAPKASRDDVLLAHSADHISFIESRIPAAPALDFIDNDTALCAASLDAAYQSVGLVLHAVEQVISGVDKRVFCAVRPPGHHAHRAKSGGFCIFNNVAIGALKSLQHAAINKVGIIDFDVHHGDGTQHIMWDNPDIMFASMHQQGIYPYGGAVTETGAHDTIFNVPLPAGTTGAELIEAFLEKIVPSLRAFQPDIIFVSAGFDGHIHDPIGGWAMQTQDYATLMHHIVDLSDELAQGRLIAVLEGGYNTHYLAEAVAACIRVMMKD